MLYDRKEAILNNELAIQEALLLELFDNDAPLTIFDIGSCEGESSIRYSRLFPNAKIWAFEPIPDNYKIICSNISEYNANKVNAFELCLSNQTGEAEFHVSSGKPDEFKDKNIDWEFGNKSSSLLPPEKTLETFKWLEFKKAIKVQTTRLDTFMEEQQIPSIEFVHMDVQGAELMVLDGAGKRFNDLKSIWLEVEAIPLYKGQPIRKDVEAYFRAKGYVKVIDTVDKVAGDQFWCNAEWIIEKMGKPWLDQKKEEISALEASRKITIVQRIRNKVQLRTRLKKLFD